MEFPPSGCGAPGEWTSYASGDSYRAYTLSCGSLFLVHLRDTGGSIYYTFNGHSNVTKQPLQAVISASEREVVRRVREMLPAYRAVHARALRGKG